jgi:transposase
VVLPIIKALGIEELVDATCPMKAGDHVRHGLVVVFLILHLLQAPHRLPLYKMDGWALKHHVGLLLGCDPSALNDDRIGRALEAVGEAVSDLESQLVTRAIQVYNVPVQFVHWDLTHVTFSGAYEDSALVAPGYGNGAMHEKQLHVSLHTSSEYGIPLLHETLPGNAQQAPLADSLLKQLQDRLPSSDVVILSDCAGVTYDTMVAYEQAGAHFLGPLEATPCEREQLASIPQDQFVDSEFRPMRDRSCQYSYYDTPLTITRQRKPEARTVRALFVHSTTKHRADALNRMKLLLRTLQRLEFIAGWLNRNRYAQFGFALGQLSKAIPRELQGVISYDLQGDDKHLRLRFVVDWDAFDLLARADGRYILVTDLQDVPADELFHVYKRHTSIEARFSGLKTDLSVQPAWLRKDSRIRGMLAVFIMALTVFALMGLCAERAGIQGDHYHKMTPRQIIFHFSIATVFVTRLLINGVLYDQEITLSDDQHYIIKKLGFPDPTTHLVPDST